MTTTMHPLLQQYFDDASRFADVVAAGGTWDGVSPCEAWTAGDVLDHVVDTQRSFLEQRGLDAGARPSGTPAETWAAHQDILRELLADEELVTQEYDGYFGRTTIADTLANFYGFDMVVHRWDLARGLGREETFTEDELDRMDRAIAGFGDAMYSEGVCKPALDVPDDASRQERILARMGRRA